MGKAGTKMTSVVVKIMPPFTVFAAKAKFCPSCDHTLVEQKEMLTLLAKTSPITAVAVWKVWCVVTALLK